MEEIKPGTFAKILPLLKKLKKKEEEEENYRKELKLHSCDEKVKYTKKEAKTKRNYLNKTGKRVRDYKCNLCKYYHLTHQIKKGFLKRYEKRWT